MLLAAVYQQGVVRISLAQEAWQLYKLPDQLDRPGMLDSVKILSTAAVEQSCAKPHLQLCWKG